MKDLGSYRKSYDQNELVESNLIENPFDFFNKWFQEVEQFGGIEEVNAMTISTIGSDGFPKSRIVLLKQIEENGFVFYTNYDSEKGKSILKNPQVSISFFWPNLERQVIIKGIAEKTTSEISDKYFNSRPKGSQMGALVSPQSEIIPNREFLEKRLTDFETEFQNNVVPRPENWGGFLVQPVSFEFWQGRPNRLHDRIRYSIQPDLSWKTERLAP